MNDRPLSWSQRRKLCLDEARTVALVARERANYEMTPAEFFSVFCTLLRHILKREGIDPEAIFAPRPRIPPPPGALYR